MKTSSTWSAFTPARSSAHLIAIAPSFGAESGARPPRNEPIGVLAAPRITALTWLRPIVSSHDGDTSGSHREARRARPGARSLWRDVSPAIRSGAGALWHWCGADRRAFRALASRRATDREPSASG